MPVIQTEKVSRRIEAIRRRLGWTQEQLARHLQVSQPAISQYLRNRLPPADVLYELARLGNTTMEWLVSGEQTYESASEPARVRDSQPQYDAGRLLMRKLDRLPVDVREALMLLIDRVSDDNGGPPQTADHKAVD